MLCLNCVRRRTNGELCAYCGECPHLCAGKCPQLTRIRKIDAARSASKALENMPVKKKARKEPAPYIPKKHREEKPAVIVELGIVSCPICETNFQKLHPDHSYCDKKCRATAYRKRSSERNKVDLGSGQCSKPTCENEFKKIHPLQLYCSSKCRRSVQNSRLTGISRVLDT